MVKKKSVKRKVSSSRTKSLASSSKNRERKRVFKRTKFDQKKFNLVTKRLIFFIIGFIASFILFFVTANEILEEIFGLLAIVFGFISIAFLIIFLIFFFMKILKK